MAARGRGGTLGRLQPATNGSLFISARQFSVVYALWAIWPLPRTEARAPSSLLFMPPPPADENLTEQAKEKRK